MGTVNVETVKQSGGQPGNRHAEKHGLTPRRRPGMPLFTLPASQEYIHKQVCQLRGIVEQAVLATHGVIDLYRCALIQTCCIWAAHAAKAAAYLRDADDKLSVQEKLHFSRECARALERRDAALERMGLSPGEGDGGYTFDLPAYEDDPIDPPLDDQPAADDQPPAPDHPATFTSDAGENRARSCLSPANHEQTTC